MYRGDITDDIFKDIYNLKDILSTHTHKDIIHIYTHRKTTKDRTEETNKRL